ncbi:hypothetical protein TCAL_15412 [Tigriopus californicus]|uniref:CUB domain-containing protein n=1 Tax=Tigriopus californicus TaxID=6832 RepID=A0A553PRG1_TIGCA|nr:hypothetical protein TCAL_15412 [Tigriopus californicus]
MITGPSTSTVIVSAHKGGVIGAPGATKPISLASRCLTDTFSVLTPSGQSPPSICGINTGEHMYVDSSATCNDLVFQLGNTVQGTGVGQRQWSIKVLRHSSVLYPLSFLADRQPFNIRFLSDAFEGDMEILMGVMSGFKLTYLQTSNGCNN